MNDQMNKQTKPGQGSDSINQNQSSSYTGSNNPESYQKDEENLQGAEELETGSERFRENETQSGKGMNEGQRNYFKENQSSGNQSGFQQEGNQSGNESGENYSQQNGNQGNWNEENGSTATQH